MRAFSLLLVGLTQFLFANGSDDGGKRVLCYYAGTPDHCGNTLQPEDIDATLCTHLVYKNGRIDNATYTVLPRSPEEAYYENGGKGYYERITKLKEVNPRLKVLLHINGCCNRQIFTTSSGRSSYIGSAVAILQRYGFDGLHVDEFHQRMADLSSPVSFIDMLLTEMRAEFDKHGYLIVTALPGNEDISHTISDFSVRARTSDIITVETFFYWGAWKKVTGLSSSLASARPIIDLYISKNVSANKMHIMVPAFAMASQLVDVNETGIGAAVLPPVGVRDFGVPYIIGYGQLAKRFKNQTEEWKIHRDEHSNEPYASNKDGLWVSYEDPISVAAKCRYAIKNNLGGMTIMQLDMDDYEGNGGEGRYPLTRAIYDTVTKRMDAA